jgi:hypothetical protein
VIGDYMTEINVTSPTGVRESQALRRRRYRRVVLGLRGSETGIAALERRATIPVCSDATQHFLFL